MNQEAHGEAVSRAFLENLHLPEFIINQMYINGQYYHPTFYMNHYGALSASLFYCCCAERICVEARCS